MIEIYQKFRSALRAHTLAKIVVQAISWLGMIYVLRTLDAHDLGVYAIATVAFGYASLMYEGGMLEALVQRPPELLDERRSVFSMMMLMAVILAALLAALAASIAALTGAPEVELIICVLAASLLLTASGMLPHARLIHDMRFGRLAVISSIQAGVSSSTMIGLAWYGAGAWSLVWGQIVGALARTILLNQAEPSVWLPTRRLAGAVKYMNTSALLIVDGLLFRWYTSLDVFLLGRWSGTTPLGHFSFGQQIANTPLEKISNVVNDVSLPAYTRLAQDRSGAAELMVETIRTHAAIGFPVFWGIASVAPTAVPLIFGAQWLPAIFPLIALAAIAPLRLIGSVETPAMTGIGRAGVLVWTKLIIVPVMTVALVAGAWWNGIVGVSLAWLCVFPPIYLVAFRLVLRAMGVRFGRVVAAVWGPALAALIMAAIVAGLQHWMLGGDIAPVIRLAVLITCGAGLYPLALWLLDGKAFDLLRRRARLMLPERR